MWGFLLKKDNRGTDTIALRTIGFCLLLTVLIVLFLLVFLKPIESGPIGDTIGGIAGPILNFAGMVLVYLSLRRDISVLKDQQSEERSKRALQLAEHSIRAAGKEMKLQMSNYKDAIRLLKDHNQAIDLAKGTGAKVPFPNEITGINNKLAPAAALLIKAYKMLSSPDISEDYKSYCMDLYRQKCVYEGFLYDSENYTQYGTSREVNEKYNAKMIKVIADIQTSFLMMRTITSFDSADEDYAKVKLLVNTPPSSTEPS